MLAVLLHQGREALVGRFLAGVTVSPVKNTYLVDIGYESESQERCARYANALAEAYIVLLDEQAGTKTRLVEQKIGEQTQNLEDLPVQAHEEWIFLNRNSIDVSLLREVEEALERIEEGAYGDCMDCDEPISTKRLEAIPWARYCISCQEELAAIEAESRLAENKSRL